MTMREKIARALNTLEWDGTQIWERKPEVYQRRYLEQADTVMATLREPTAYMVDRGCVAWLRPHPGVDDPRLFGEKIIDVWQKMVEGGSSDEVGNPETQAMIDATRDTAIAALEQK